MKSILISSLCAALLSPAMVYAADGTINFTGTVVAVTCTYSAPSKTQNITLPPVSVSALGSPTNTNTNANTAGDTAFTVELGSCSTARNVAISLEGPTFDIATGYLKNTTTNNAAAANVQVQLVDRTNNTVLQAYANTAGVQPTGDGKAVIPLLARYVAVGTAGAGTVTSSVNFSIMYP